MREPSKVHQTGRQLPYQVYLTNDPRGQYFDALGAIHGDYLGETLVGEEHLRFANDYKVRLPDGIEC